MARDSLHYDKMVETALRGVVRQALASVVDQGLPGNHHFYLTFRTNHPDVDIADRLHAQYPQEMTIVLQHQFWGLEVTDEYFVVNLSFSNVPERLKVPYAALVSFVDPSVKFGLQFQVQDGGTAAAAAADKPLPATTIKEAPALALATVDGQAEKPKDETKVRETAAKETVAKEAAAKDAAPAKKPAPAAEPAASAPAADADTEKKDPEKVVSLDAFRKKQPLSPSFRRPSCSKVRGERHLQSPFRRNAAAHSAAQHRSRYVRLRIPQDVSTRPPR